ncbi:MAG TPA: tripartite tricarboxylate transporter substrate binding protein, partial [Burkholderiales bacterium]|nr:tripartite tricarboxylate transporter substrate binding protein [Burkholderiales bacterium]
MNALLTANRALILGVISLLAASPAWAQSSDAQRAAYPNKPMHLLMPFPAGGTPDALARTVSTQVESQLGQT